MAAFFSPLFPPLLKSDVARILKLGGDRDRVQSAAAVRLRTFISKEIMYLLKNFSVFGSQMRTFSKCFLLIFLA